ncbi:MAG: hypothetical protein IPL51_08960 [Candidatus Competibacteraceae bacterium]|nr:hypothetical protein [Candidatus Competibacteraceae bacterium]
MTAKAATPPSGATLTVAIHAALACKYGLALATVYDILRRERAARQPGLFS